MKRTIEEELKEWKTRPDRKPLLIRGARQIGKTFSIEKFGRECFESYVVINFEEIKDVRRAFEQDLTAAFILRDIQARLKQPIVPGKTLVFFDEIQACPDALKSLRFFKEQLPNLHLVAAGSLLEFILGEEHFSFPVGRVDNLFMYPLSFVEFLEAKGSVIALEWLKEASPEQPIGHATHENLLSSVREYFIVGGMPEAINTTLSTQSYMDLDRVHQNLRNTYENDLSKYPKTSQIKFMRLLFEAAPRLVCQHFKYAKIHPHAQSRDYLESLEVLSRSGLLHRIFANSAAGVPLVAQILEKKWKLLFMDIGLLPQPMTTILDAKDLTKINDGDLAEQFVGQELVAYGKPYARPELYYWEREKRGSEAEVDYVIAVGPNIIPIEVKSGKKGSLRSLHQFMQEKKSRLGICISQAPLSLSDTILHVPFYMIREIPRLVEKIIS